jgi:glycine/D-amino acid oxidase-like deaminating enzyme
MTSTQKQSISARLSELFDVAVIGGGAAGLSAAVQLGRSLIGHRHRCQYPAQRSSRRGAWIPDP